MESKTLLTNFSNEKELMDAVIIYMQAPTPYSVRTTTVDVIRTIGSKVNAWNHSMISTLLSMVTISSADILSLKQEAVYVVEAS